ncbi:sulfate adenylyltransferase subunit CysN [Ensifer sp. T173]|uniref:Multifunctional fusion protein n=1 Tax=Ensifer canadensis TaxID=555315 RepID=A0AAW4FVQ5_9HYPH|nr:sulfate adenylyltransferase subunit CysN [Ensifer canadensis]MBM3095502.1 sulfate adenylyltransferase subunit CysN [Ensifer canadensis]UBI79100.1 sulfate adenylyltransferase subunit CysN [Ensifer canadensis]
MEGAGGHPKGADATEINASLERHRSDTMLRFLTCGSVDDGKSTLIGRLLFDSKAILADQLASLEHDSQSMGTQGGALDFALLTDGLAAEREQGITIDVAYRFFSTDRRKFIVADTPGHEQYTRNMVTGASTADLAAILVDARKGILTQTRRHSFLVNLLGIRNVVLAVNKMDLVGYSAERFSEIVAEYSRFAKEIDIKAVQAIPISALKGDNLVSSSPHTPWYDGPTLLSYLEGVPSNESRLQDSPFRMAVQWVNRPHPDFRGFTGQIASGHVKPGDPVQILPSGRHTTVKEIPSFDGPQSTAIAGQSVTLTFEDEVDCARGDLITAANAPIEVANQFSATLVWMSEDAMLSGRPYLMKIGTRTVMATVTDLRYELNVNTLEHLASKTLSLNAIGLVNISTDRPIPFEAYADNPDLGGFILIDVATDSTVAAGMIRFALRRARNIHWQALDIGREAHAALKNQKPAVVWFTGLSGAGKSTIANLVEKKLYAMGKHTFLLDGDNVRQGLNRDLGFTAASRVENIRRVGEVAKLMTDAGLIVLTAFISPFRSERQMVRELIGAEEFFEVFVCTPLEVAEARDVKGLYKKARAGQIENFTGIDSPYEVPVSPELIIDTVNLTAEEAADQIVAMLLG